MKTRMLCLAALALLAFCCLSWSLSFVEGLRAQAGLVVAQHAAPVEVRS